MPQRTWFIGDLRAGVRPKAPEIGGHLRYEEGAGLRALNTMAPDGSPLALRTRSSFVTVKDD